MSLGGNHLHLIILNGACILIEEEISRVDEKDILFALPYFLYPGTPSGKTTDLALLPSGRAGVGFGVKIVAVEKRQGFRSFLGMEGGSLHSPEDFQT